MSEQYSTAFHAVAELALALDAAPLSKHDGCWTCRIDDKWTVAVNGHKEPQTMPTGEKVEPWNCYVEYLGWPAGIITPFGGVLVAGEGANENTFIDAVNAALELAKAGKP